jgi:hypothetical protein
VSVGETLAGWAIKLFGPALVRGFAGWLESSGRHTPTTTSSLVVLLGSTLALGALFAATAASLLSVPVSAALGITLLWATSLSLALPLYYIKAVGIIRADQEIRTGFKYESALLACQNSLSFLGIGASKLTARTEFAEAIQRCSSNEPARLLLCDPDSKALEASAKQAGKPSDEYARLVRESLRKIADLRDRRGLRIEVRLYRDSPETFRIMLIDDRLCLVSYNALGHGDGSELPQLHVRAYEGQRTLRTFYWAFKTHFDRVWGAAEEWDFKKHL